MKFIVTMTLTFFVSVAFAQVMEEHQLTGGWKGFSAPEIFSSGFTHDFKALPLEGTVEIGPKAWSGDYWPSKKGSINIRWNSRSKAGFDYVSPTKAEASKMSLEQLAMLSPTEKFDLYSGRYDYPLKKQVDGVASKFASDWAGICNGWSPASLFHNEPLPKVVTNPEGIEIPFGSSDIKALISYFYAYHHDTGTDQIGLRCFFGSWMGGARGCADDLNAGAFHIVIANKLGLQKEGFIADVDRYREVWNQPIVSFKSKVVAANLPPSSKAAETAVREIRIATELFYIEESEENTWAPAHGTKNQIITKRDLQYRIELNAEGKIVGGEWESKERPDFLWNKRPATREEFTGLLSQLPNLLNDQE